MDRIEAREQSLADELRRHRYFEKLVFAGFSDTIIISLPVRRRPVGSDRGPTPFWWSIMAMGEVLIRLFRLSISHRFYFRGCLSAGKFFRSENMTIVPAIDEAAEYYTLPEWSGISTSPSASKILTDAEEMHASTYDYFIQYDIPLKNTTEKRGWALNWLKSGTDTEISNSKLRQFLYKESMKVSAYFKTRNTLDFFDQVNGKYTK